MGVFPGDDAFGPLYECFQQERERMVAEATARQGEVPGQQPAEADDEPAHAAEQHERARVGARGPAYL